MDHPIEYIVLKTPTNTAPSKTSPLLPKSHFVKTLNTVILISHFRQNEKLKTIKLNEFTLGGKHNQGKFS